MQSLNTKWTYTSLVREIEQVGWDFSKEQLEMLIWTSNDPALHDILALLFARTDHPGALAIVLNKEMQRDENNLHDYGDERWDISKKSPVLSEVSQDYLFREFSNPANNKTRRYIAWRFWTGNVESSTVLKEMQAFKAEEDPLYNDAVL